MKNSGWFSVHRSLDDHWLWKKEKFTKGQAWIDLLMHANHKENKTMIKGRLVVIQRGEQIRSQVTLATKWKWNPRTVKKFLDLLVLDSMITLKTTELTTHISICNYDTFQSDARKGTEQTTQHSTEQSAEGVQSRVQTNNNVNNDNNVNKKQKKTKTPVIAKPDDVEMEVWQDWLQLRKTKKASVTNTVLKGARKEAEKAGLSLNEFLSIWCVRGSQGLEASWLTPKEKQPHRKELSNGYEQKDTRSRAQKVSDRLDEIARRDIEENGFTQTLD